MSSIYYHHQPASNVIFPELAGQKREANRKQKSRTLNYEISISINYPSFGHITWCLSMNPDVINGWDIGGLAGHR
jgi:hypothetical protein